MNTDETQEDLTDKLSLKDFQILKNVGEGAFSNVYMAVWMSNKDSDSPDFVAIKIISKSDTAELDLTSKIYNEVKILSCVSHEFLIKYYNSFYSKNSLNIVLEYLPTSVFQILKKKLYLGEPTTRYFSSQILLALEFLHSKNIAYRDLKPENTLITSNWIVKLTDFSFAKHISGRSYTCQGTLEYMAPEIVLNQGHGLAVDWWAFGVLLYELCAGYSPFKTKYQLNLMRRIISSKFQFPPHFSDELRDLIKQLLVVDATKRMGCVQGREHTIKSHAWYADEIDWDKNQNFFCILPKELNDLNLDEDIETDITDVELLF